VEEGMEVEVEEEVEEEGEEGEATKRVVALRARGIRMVAMRVIWSGSGTHQYAI
jgi:hypothetical protein